MKIDKTYLKILEKLNWMGYNYEDPNRKGVTRTEIPTVTLKHLHPSFPILTLRKTFFKGAVGELLLFLKGSTDIRDYWANNIFFWNGDWIRHQGLDKDVDYAKQEQKETDDFYSMGPIYGAQYARQYDVFDRFKKNHFQSDLIVNSWNVDELDKMCLKPCHYSFQLVSHIDGFVVVWNQRSTDFILGTPINVQFYYLMGMLLEKWSGHRFYGVIGNLSKVHIYDNQVDLAATLLETEPKKKLDVGVTINMMNKFTEMKFSEFIKQFEVSDFKLEGYEYRIDQKVPMLTYSSEKTCESQK